MEKSAGTPDASGEFADAPVTSDAEMLGQRNRELMILNSIAQALNASVEMDEALQAALAQVADLLGCIPAGSGC